MKNPVLFLNKNSVLLFLLLIQGISLLGQPCNPDLLDHRTIRAIDTDSNIDWELHMHQVFINPSCIQNEKLLLHLVGSFDNPASTTFFSSLAANHGYKVINLKYENGTPALTACGNTSDPDCYFNYRQEIVFGDDVSSGVDVDASHSIINRIEKLLVYLNENHPSENWSDFLDNVGRIDWSNIVLSGHSQGGGHAAFIAKVFKVTRVLMFASPNDYSNVFAAPAEWVASESMTPASDHFAFGNQQDNISAFSNQFEIWTNLDLLIENDSIRVDNSLCNYNNSQVLYTTSNFSVTHNNMVIDDFTPLSGGEPTFTPVWEYMLGVCDLSNTKNTHQAESILDVYPNPASSLITIQSDDIISRIAIYNSSGCLVKNVYPRENSYTLDVKPYNGLMLFNITSGKSNRIVSKKIIVR